MSPRAAWRLEELGFQRVYDFVGGKIAWLVQGLPTEGTGPHHAVAAEVTEPATATCRPDSAAGLIRMQLQRGPDSICAVVNDHGVVLGRVRWKDLPTDDDVLVADFMQPGPATVRPAEELPPLIDRMKRAGVKTILVTTSRGHLVGVVNRDAAQARILSASARSRQ